MSQLTAPTTYVAQGSFQAAHHSSGFPTHDILISVFLIAVCFIVVQFVKVREAFKLIPAVIEADPEPFEVQEAIEKRKADLRRIEPLVLSNRLAVIYSEMAITLDRAEREMWKGQYQRAMSLERRAMRAFHAFGELFNHYIINYPTNLDSRKPT